MGAASSDKPRQHTVADFDRGAAQRALAIETHARHRACRRPHDCVRGPRPFFTTPLQQPLRMAYTQIAGQNVCPRCFVGQPETRWLGTR